MEQFLLNCAEVLKRHDQCSSEYEAASFAMIAAMSPAHKEQLGQLINSGPVWDGDVISKSHRTDLIRLGLASRACVKGEQGFTAANYQGWDVFTAANP